LIKTITVRDEVYKKLLAMKRTDESFSDLLDRLLETVDSAEILAKLRAKVEFTEKEKMLSEISNKRAERR
jgi:predicted CopG family antitoxin